MIFKKKKNTNEDNTYDNQPQETDEVVRISDIYIPPEFARTKPLDYKMRRCMYRYLRLHHLDKPISVIPETNERGKPNRLVLVDGYSRYLYAKQIDLTRVPVKYINNNI